jgi:hypothetical protein
MTKTPAKRVPRKKKTEAEVEQTPHTPSEQIEKAAALKPPTVAHVPDYSVYQKYIGRRFVLGGGASLTDMEMYDYAYKQGRNVLLEGPTGPGKTLSVRAWAALRKMMVARIPSNSGIDASQLFGRHVPDPRTGGFRWVDGPVTYVFRHGGVIIWNEINFTPERIGSVMFGALDDQREIVLLDHESEVLRAHRGHANGCWCSLEADDCDSKRVLIVADMNPNYLGTRELNAALRNRFSLQLDWDYDTAVEEQLVMCKPLRDLAAKIRADENYDTPVSTNMLMEFGQIALDLTAQFALDNFINHFSVEERDPIRLVCNASSAGIKMFYEQKQQEARRAVQPDKVVDPTPAPDGNVPATGPGPIGSGNAGTTPAPATATQPSNNGALNDPGLADWLFTSKD